MVNTINEPKNDSKNTIRELTLNELDAVSGGDGGVPCPPGVSCGDELSDSGW
jgi:hypothetical protein